MTDEERNHEALFRHAILGDVLSRTLRRGQLRPALKQLAQQTWQDHRGRSRRVAYKTLEEWFYKYRHRGFDALKPRPRKDRNQSRVLAQDVQQLILDMKREDPGRSAHLILRELELAGRIGAGQAGVSSVQRLLHRHGLSVPRMEWDHAARYRWEASSCGELWQADALHGPILMNPTTGRNQRVIVFGLIDDRSRLIPYLEGGFGETEQRFLTVLYQAMARRGIVRKLLLDNHASFSGYDLRLLCARLGIHLVHSRPGDAPSKGKIERVWRTLRGQLIERLDLERVTTIDEFNLRLWTWVESEYHHQPHSSLSGRTSSATIRPCSGARPSMRFRLICAASECVCVMRCWIPPVSRCSMAEPRFLSAASGPSITHTARARLPARLGSPAIHPKRGSTRPN